MSTPYDMTPQDIRQGMKLCLEYAIKLLTIAKNVSGSDRYISSGLYTYAVEEVGKLLLLKKELSGKTPNGMGIISVDPAIFKIHEKKFNEFLNDSSISNVCKDLEHVTGGIPTGKSLIPLFEKAKTRFSLRMEMFFVDWNNCSWVRRKDMEMRSLNEAINELEKWLSQVSI